MRLPGEEDDGGFHDRENKRQEWRCDEAEFDCGGAIVLADKPARDLQRKRKKRTARDASIFFVKAVMSRPETAIHIRRRVEELPKSVVELLKECRISPGRPFILR